MSPSCLVLCWTNRNSAHCLVLCVSPNVFTFWFFFWFLVLTGFVHFWTLEIPWLLCVFHDLSSFRKDLYQHIFLWILYGLFLTVEIDNYTRFKNTSIIIFAQNFELEISILKNRKWKWAWNETVIVMSVSNHAILCRIRIQSALCETGGVFYTGGYFTQE